MDSHKQHLVFWIKESYRKYSVVDVGVGPDVSVDEGVSDNFGKFR